MRLDYQHPWYRQNERQKDQNADDGLPGFHYKVSLYDDYYQINRFNIAHDSMYNPMDGERNISKYKNKCSGQKPLLTKS